MSSERSELARLLQRSRERAGYSRTALGKLLEVNPKTIESWESGKIRRPQLHDVIRMATFLQIPFEAIQQAAFADAGSIPDAAAQPERPVRRKPGRKKPAAAVVPLLEAGFAVCGWEDEQEAAQALGVTTKRVRAWRHGREPLDLGSHLRLSASVNLALADALKENNSGERIRIAAEALGVNLSG